MNPREPGGPERRPRDALRPAWEFAATGTRWRLYHDGTLPRAVADTVIDAVAGDEARWSRFRADSEVSTINRRAGAWTPVSAETFALLDLCAAWTRRSGGVFTPLVGSALGEWGYAQSLGHEPAGRERSPLPAAVSGAVALDSARRSVRLPAGAGLDLGGIGKGWIAARVSALIASLDPGHDVLIDAGGDLVSVDGTHLVAVESIADDGPASLGFVQLTAGSAIATSGFKRRQWRNGDGVAAHHLIDPRTGAPGPRVHATVIAGDPVSADVTAKILALRPERLEDCGVAALVQDERAAVWGANWHFAEEVAASRPVWEDCGNASQGGRERSRRDAAAIRRHA